MAFAIMRAKKLNSMGTVEAALQHCYRDRETPNADQERTPDNEHMAATSTDQAMGRLRELLPEKRRKDAVLAVEYVMTASPEWWTKADQEQQADFFDQAHKWLADKYGADRIITATIHRDETSPHLSAFVVPLTQDGRLSAKEFIGNRSKMTADQTSFAKAVEHLGLERGIERSRATHTSIKQHYAAIERAAVGHVTISPEAVKPQVIKKGIFTRQEETPEAVAERLTAAVTKAYEPMTAKAAESAQNARRSRELQETMVSQRERLKALQRPFEGLTKEQMTEVLQFAAAKQRENAKEKERRQAQRQLNRQQQRGRDGGGLSR
ncbi:plasmid recombination protein [Campylobacter coli]|nr:plasmid recombination protein [Campylobacter coli]